MIRFITGLPRCRTKWFAEYFDGIDGVEAEHEPLCGLRTKQEFYDIVESGVISSDSGLFLTDFQERYPEAKTVIIERNAEDVYESLCEFFEEQGYPHPSFRFVLKQQAALSKMTGLRVPFERIDASMPAIHAYLGIPYDKGYHSRMQVQNLQIPVLIPDVESYELWASF